MIFDYFAAVDSEGIVRNVRKQQVPNEGPSLPVDSFTYYLVDAPIDWSAQPTETHVLKWNDGECQWEETVSVALLKAKKNEEINATRESVNSSTFLFRNKAIQCRPLDRSDIDGTNGYVALFGTFPDEWMGAWKAADNSYVPISTVDDWKEFYKAMVDTGRANFRYAQQLKGRLAAATTAEEIAAIKWETPIV